MSLRTPKLITIVLAILAGFSLLAFAACGGDDDDDATTRPTNTSQATDSGDDTATDAPDDGDNGDDGGDDTGDDVFGEFDGFTGNVDQAEGKTSYEVTDEDGDVSQMTFYATEGKSRFDSTDSNGSVTSFITNEDGTFVCDSSDETCIQYPGSGIGGVNPFAAMFSSQTLAAYAAAAEIAGVDIDKSDENIAGTDATCFQWDASDDDDSFGKFCFAEDGTMLSQEYGDSSGTSTKIVATDYTADVSDSDFEPPYPVSTIPGLPQ